MAFDDVMGLTTRLLVQAQALAALTARLRLAERGAAGDPALRPQLDRVVDCLDARELCDELTPKQRAVVTGFATSYLRQALDLLEHPERPGEWSHSDPAVLQAQGAASAVVASLIAGAGLGRPDAHILDVGTGVARLAIAFCETYPAATVVGLDPWEPSLRLARQNVAAAGLETRITLLDTPVERFHDDAGFDLVWLPSFFIPETALDTALANVLRVTRPGGAVVVGVSDVSEDELTGAVDDLMTVRSGGTPLTPAQAITRLERAGFGAVREIERSWRAPLRLVVGVQAAGGVHGAAARISASAGAAAV
jgi:SAM-dependent methyltransferase